MNALGGIAYRLGLFRSVGSVFVLVLEPERFLDYPRTEFFLTSYRTLINL